MTKEIWTAVDQLANKWRSSQTVHRVVSVMPRDGVPSKPRSTDGPSAGGVGLIGVG